MNAAPTGRKPAGPQIVERLEGSPVAKQRLEVILETIAGRWTIPEACHSMGGAGRHYGSIPEIRASVAPLAIEDQRLTAESLALEQD